MADLISSPEVTTEGLHNGTATTNGKTTDPNAGKSQDPNSNQSQEAPKGTDAGEPGDPSRMDQAEKLADSLAANVAVYTALFGRKVIRLTAHLREAVEDMWAEAQSIRRGDK